MLRGLKHTQFYRISVDSEKFSFKQISGKVVKRRFFNDDVFTLIFDISNYQYIKLKEMRDIFKELDDDYHKSVNDIFINYARYDKNGLVTDVCNDKLDSSYHSCFMLILNQNFDTKNIDKFWLMTDLYIEESYKDKNFNSNTYNYKKRFFENIYRDRFVTTKKRRYDEEENDYRKKSKFNESQDEINSIRAELEILKRNAPLVQSSHQGIPTMVSSSHQGIPPLIPSNHPGIPPLVPSNHQGIPPLDSSFNSSFSSVSSLSNRESESMEKARRYYRDACGFKKQLDACKSENKKLKERLQGYMLENTNLTNRNEELTKEITQMNTRFNTQYLYN
mgnify:CR=1 FL=1|tara:strand:+ start:123 stop:1124 length:1002 start_codon:yes stop_codon:yes gene_type:complete